MVATVTVLDSAGSTQTVNTLPALGQANKAGSLPVALASDTGTLPVSLSSIPTLGQAAKAASLPVAIASDQDVLSVAGTSAVATATFNRPADTTAYASGDLVANSTTAGSVAPMAFTAARVNAGTGGIVRARLSTNKTGLAGTEGFRLHLFKSSPTVTNGDNGVFLAAGVAAIHIGIFDFVLDRVFSDGAKGIAAPAVGGQIVFDAAAGSQSIYGLLEARGAYTPASGETFVVALEVLRD